jgi:hypothetical protein
MAKVKICPVLVSPNNRDVIVFILLIDLTKKQPAISFYSVVIDLKEINVIKLGLINMDIRMSLLHLPKPVNEFGMSESHLYLASETISILIVPGFTLLHRRPMKN